MLGLQTRRSLIGDVRGGRGFMAAIELVTDRSTKATVSLDLVLRVQKLVFGNGATVRASCPTITISLQLLLPEKDADTMIGALDKALASN